MTKDDNLSRRYPKTKNMESGRKDCHPLSSRAVAGAVRPARNGATPVRPPLSPRIPRTLRETALFQARAEHLLFDGAAALNKRHTPLLTLSPAFHPCGTPPYHEVLRTETKIDPCTVGFGTPAGVDFLRPCDSGIHPREESFITLTRKYESFPAGMTEDSQGYCVRQHAIPLETRTTRIDSGRGRRNLLMECRLLSGPQTPLAIVVVVLSQSLIGRVCGSASAPREEDRCEEYTPSIEPMRHRAALATPIRLPYDSHLVHRWKTTPLSARLPLRVRNPHGITGGVTPHHRCAKPKPVLPGALPHHLFPSISLWSIIGSFSNSLHYVGRLPPQPSLTTRASIRLARCSMSRVWLP